MTTVPELSEMGREGLEDLLEGCLVAAHSWATEPSDPLHRESAEALAQRVRGCVFEEVCNAHTILQLLKSR